MVVFSETYAVLIEKRKDLVNSEERYELKLNVQNVGYLFLYESAK